MKLSLILLFISCLTLVAFADSNDPQLSSNHYLSAGIGQGVLIFGSEDERFGESLNYAYGRYEPRFSIRNGQSQLVYEGYVDHTQTDGPSYVGDNSTTAFGVLAYARWFWQLGPSNRGVYFDFGWGLQLADHPTLDLDSQLNSTPVAGIGTVVRVANRDLLCGIRYLHISNAGLKGHNFGENELFLMITLMY